MRSAHSSTKCMHAVGLARERADLLVRAGIGDALARLEDLFDPGALDRRIAAPTNVRPVPRVRR
ncbi:MAG: hypothetical protein U0235_17985 [Polyangiaceae bacterium]